MKKLFYYCLKKVANQVNKIANNVLAAVKSVVNTNQKKGKVCTYNASTKPKKGTVCSVDINQIINTSSSSTNNIPETHGNPFEHKSSPDGTKERWFDENGDPFKDRHHTDHGNPGKHPLVPHDQYWEKLPNGRWKLPSTEYPPTDDDIPRPPEIAVDPSTGVAIGVTIIAGYYLIK